MPAAIAIRNQNWVICSLNKPQLRVKLCASHEPRCIYSHTFSFFFSSWFRASENLVMPPVHKGLWARWVVGTWWAQWAGTWIIRSWLSALVWVDSGEYSVHVHDYYHCILQVQIRVNKLLKLLFISLQDANTCKWFNTIIFVIGMRWILVSSWYHVFAVISVFVLSCNMWSCVAIVVALESFEEDTQEWMITHDAPRPRITHAQPPSNPLQRDPKLSLLSVCSAANTYPAISGG